MNYKEISEHLKMNPPKNHTWINDDNLKMIMSGVKEIIPLIMFYGKYEIWRNGNYFGIIKDKKLYGFAQIEQHKGNVYHLKKLETRKDVNTTDMAAALFHYIIQDLGITLLSDNVMSDKGIDFWNKMRERGQVIMSVYDILENETYPLDMIGKLTRNKPQVVILSPETDVMQQDRDENGNITFRTYYRFFWCAVGINSHYVKEAAKNYPREYFMFGVQEYPDYQ